MQLDRTRIAVRERTQIELMDLGLHVLRAYGARLLPAALFGIVPLMLLNEYLLGWLLDPSRYDFGIDFLPYRYLWNMSLLVFLEAPLGTIAATVLLASSTFEERPTMREVLLGVWNGLSQLMICQVVFRGPLIGWLLIYSARFESEFSLAEFWLMMLVGVVGLVRANRTFLPEVAVLERLPWRSSNPLVMTLSKRMTMLHAVVSLFPRWLTMAVICVILGIAIAHGFLFVSGIVLYDWRWGPWLIRIGCPASMWLVAIYVAVVRFLSYLDTRIRNEGWEVELLLRAEASRFQPKVIA
ncbi:MAG: hypothetical protein RLY70_4601 [Planctomycetota bacterium]|jgi:hypothetical protein